MCGYGVMRVRKKRMKVHRFSYEIHSGPVPAGHHVHHTCGEKLCVRRSHLEAMKEDEHHVHHNHGRMGKRHATHRGVPIP